VNLTDSNIEYTRIRRSLLETLNNGMIYIKDVGLVLHEMKGKVFAYSLSLESGIDENKVQPCSTYKTLESWF
jgi:hypothetical protein